jgi:ParB family chromosome partitioning protein
LAALLGNPVDEEGQPIENRLEDTPTTGDEQIGDVASLKIDGESAGGLLQLNVYEIDDNPFQPRREFSESEISSLSESLKEHDMLQPVLVRRVDGRFQLISGERRLRAAVQAGWSTIPARIRDADDRLVAELAIVENLQRKDLNPIEKAMSFKRYLDEHQCTQEYLASRLKIDRSTIANLVRLLELPDIVIGAVRTGTVSMGHARALLPLGEEEQQVTYCDRIQQEGLSVRDIERMVKQELAGDDDDFPSSNSTPGRPRQPPSSQVEALQQQLRMALGTTVDIRQASRGRGRIVIHFGGHAEFERLRDLLTYAGPSEQEKAA